MKCPHHTKRTDPDGLKAVTDEAQKQRYMSEALRLTGKPWHGLSVADTSLTITLQAIGLLDKPRHEHGHTGECFVGPVTFELTTD